MKLQRFRFQMGKGNGGAGVMTAKHIEAFKAECQRVADDKGVRLRWKDWPEGQREPKGWPEATDAS